MRIEKKTLDIFLSLYVLQPKVSLWNSTTFEKNPPRYVRWQMFNACLNALQLPTNPSSFIDGSFIWELNLSYNLHAWKDLLQKTVNFKSPEIALFFDWDSSDLASIYQQCMAFRLQAENLKMSTQLFYEAPKKITLFTDALKKPLEQLESTIYDIDCVLGFLINPKNLDITQEKLETDYVFPKIDLNAIDDDFF